VTISLARDTPRKGHHVERDGRVMVGGRHEDTQNSECAQTRNAKPRGVNTRRVANRGQASARDKSAGGVKEQHAVILSTRLDDDLAWYR